MRRILALIAAVLMCTNAYCFIRCDLDASSRGVPPCHAQTKIIADHCIEQHESAITLGASHTIAAELPAASEIAPALPPLRLPRVDLSPPDLSFASSIAPLRI